MAELNYGQLVGEVERATEGRCPVHFCGKYDMHTYEPQDLTQAIDAMLAGGEK